MATLSAIYGADPLDNDDVSNIAFSNDSNESVNTTALDNTPSDLLTMDDTAFTLHVRYKLSSTHAGSDTYGLRMGIRNSGDTAFLAGDSSSAAKVMDADVTNDTIAQADIDISGAGGYVDTSADKAAWDGATVWIEQDYSQDMGKDGLHIIVYQAWITGTYTQDLGPSITDVETDEDFRDGDTSLTITGTNFEASQGTGKVELSDNATYASGTKVAQTVTSWSDTSIDFTAVLSTLTPGTLWIWVTNDSGYRNAAFTVTVHRKVAFTLAASDYITASGENTTAQLTAPATKTTADFDAGRIQDDENPADAVDITADDYTELEWSLKATDDSAEVAYVFRVVTSDDTALATYTVTPQWTVGGGGDDSTSPSSVAGTAALPTHSFGAGTGVGATAVAGSANLGALTIGAGVGVSPTALAATSSFGAPTIGEGAGVDATAVGATAAFGAYTTGAGAGISATAVGAVAAFGTHTTGAGVGHDAVAVSGTAAIPTPTFGEGAGVDATAVGATAAVGTFTVTGAGAVSPASIAAVAAFGTYTTGAGGGLASTSVAATSSFGTAATGAGSGVTATAVAATSAVPAPTVVGGGGNDSTSPVAVVAVAAFGAATTGAGSGVAATAAGATSAVPASTIAGGAAASPAAVSVAAAVGTPTLGAGWDPQPSTVAAASAIPTPTIGQGAGLTATAVAGTSGFGTPALAGGGAVVPSALGATATVPTPTVGAGVSDSAAPASVGALAAVGYGWSYAEGFGGLVVGAGAGASVAGVAALASAPASILAGGGVAVPSAFGATATIPTPTVVAGVSDSVAPVSVGALAAAGYGWGYDQGYAALVVKGGAGVVAVAVAAAAHVPVLGPAGDFGWSYAEGYGGSTADDSVAPSPVAAVAAVPTPVVTGPQIVTPASVVAAATVPAMAATGAAVVAPAAVAAGTTIPAPTTGGSSAGTTPTPVAALAGRPGSRLILDGTGDYASTPHDVAHNLSVTNEFDIRVELVPDNWTTGQRVVSKRAGATQGPWMLTLNETGQVYIHIDNGTSLSVPATLSHGYTGGERGALRITYQADNGGGAQQCDLYTASHIDGSWVLTDQDIVGLVGDSIVNRDAPVWIGGDPITGAWFAGSVIALDVYDGIDGTRFINYRAGVATDGDGNVWSLNGNAYISSDVVIGEGAGVAPGAVAAHAGTTSPTAIGGEGANVQPATVAATGDVATPTVGEGYGLSITATAGAAAVPLPTFIVGAGPSAVAAVAAVNAVSISAGSAITLTTVAGTSGVVPPTVESFLTVQVEVPSYASVTFGSYEGSVLELAGMSTPTGTRARASAGASTTRATATTGAAGASVNSDYGKAT